MSVHAQELTDSYAVYCGDCVTTMKGLASNSVHLTLYSPPFCWAVLLFFRPERPEQLHRPRRIFHPLRFLHRRNRTANQAGSHQRRACDGHTA